MPSPDFLAIGSVIIDDIVYPDGRTSMGVLGGGGAHAAYGIALAGERPGLVALIGEDLPGEIRARLDADFDARGLATTPHPQLRGWQIFEWSGLRNEIFRVETVEPFMYGPEPENKQIPFKDALGFTLLRGPAQVAAWRRRFPRAVLLWEPVRVFMLGGDRRALVETLPQCDIVSPNLHEAQTMYGVDDELELLRRLFSDGAEAAALRMGERGSLAARRGEGTAHYIPAVEVAEVIDQTGAGNTYCGGFLVGYCLRGDVADAGCYGAAAASFTLEHVGCARLPSNRDAEWKRRLAEARRSLRSVAL